MKLDAIDAVFASCRMPGVRAKNYEVIEGVLQLEVTANKHSLITAQAMNSPEYVERLREDLSRLFSVDKDKIKMNGEII